MVKTTVVIPNYNGMRYIEDCLEALKKSSVAVKILLVDNASEDGSAEFVKEHYPEVRLLAFPKNEGFSKAVNAGILASDTEYVLLLNNDTLADAHMTEYLEKELDAHQECFSAAAKMIQMREPDKLDGAGDYYCALGWAYARGRDKAVECYQKPGRIFSSCAGAALYRRSVFEEIGLFDEAHFAYLEDIDIGYRANICGYPNRYVPKAFVYHAGSGVSGSRHNEFKVRLSARNSIYLIYKNMPFLQLVLNLPFLLAGYGIKLLFFTGKGMGGCYLAGILEGVKLSFSKEGRKKKVAFRWKHFKNYCRIQLQLWLNVIRRFA